MLMWQQATFSIISALIIVLLFYKRNIKHFFILYNLIEALGKLGEHSSSWETTPLRVVVTLRYSCVLPTSPHV